MEADWDEITRIAVPSSGLHAVPPTTSAIAFDDLQELLWIGNDQVRGRAAPQIPPISYIDRAGSRPSTVPSCNGMSQSKLTQAKVQSSNSSSTKKALSLFLLPVSILSIEGA